jgi:hypothetical protein
MARQRRLGFLMIVGVFFALAIDTSSSLSFLLFRKYATRTTSTVIMSRKDGPDDVKVRNFVFGYGSLICDESRALSIPTLHDGVGSGGRRARAAAAAVALPPLPVTIHHVQRVWSARTKNGWTAVGVRFENDQNCTGVLIEVTADELANLDQREASYDRSPLRLDSIDQVSFLNQQQFYSDNHPVFDIQRGLNEEEQTKTVTAAATAAAASDEQRVMVWIYTQRDAILADSSHPIPQSYVDVILRGCLKISKDFAKSFIETTHGWDHHHGIVGDGDDDSAVHQCRFVDDREIPIYPKADPEYSNAHGKHIIDELLEEHMTHAIKGRVAYDPLNHLLALSDALENQRANPRAIKHIVHIVKEAAKRKAAVRMEKGAVVRLHEDDDGFPLVT